MSTSENKEDSGKAGTLEEGLRAIESAYADYEPRPTFGWRYPPCASCPPK